MDKKKQRKGGAKRKGDDEGGVDAEDKRPRCSEAEACATPPKASTPAAVAAPAANSYEQPVFVNAKGEPIQLAPDTVIVYDQSANSANFFGSGLLVDANGRLIMTDAVYDVKQEERRFADAGAQAEESDRECYQDRRAQQQQQQQQMHDQSQQIVQGDYEIVQFVPTAASDQIQQTDAEDAELIRFPYSLRSVSSVHSCILLQLRRH